MVSPNSNPFTQINKDITTTFQSISQWSGFNTSIQEIECDRFCVSAVLDRQVTICVPFTVYGNIPKDNSDYAEVIASRMAELFGGSSYSLQWGKYISPKVGLISEPSVVVSSHTTTQRLEEVWPILLQLVAQLKTDLGQEAIALTVDHKLLLISTT